MSINMLVESGIEDIASRLGIIFEEHQRTPVFPIRSLYTAPPNVSSQNAMEEVPSVNAVHGKIPHVYHRVVGNDSLERANPLHFLPKDADRFDMFVAVGNHDGSPITLGGGKQFFHSRERIGSRSVD